MTNERLVGLTRPIRRLTEKQQREELDGCGRIWSFDDIDRLIKYLRKGDIVVAVRAHCFGPTRAAVTDTLMRIFDKGAGVSVLYPEHIVAKCGAEAASIALQAVAGLSGDSRAHTAEEAQRHGRKSWKKKRAKRTSEEVAGKFWHSARAKEMTAEQRINEPEMRGWSITTAYRHLGAPGAKAGPKPKN